MRLCVMVCFGLISVFALVGCGADAKAGDKADAVLDTQVGDATYYAQSFHGDRTASGLIFDNRKALAAHRSYPFGTVARVTNPATGKSVKVVVVDRGPYGRNRREGAIIDLSRAAAERLGMIRDGQVRVQVDVLKWGKGERSKRDR